MNFLTGLSKCLQLIVRGSEVINEIDDLLESQDFESLKTCSLATRTTLLFLSIAEIAFAASNGSRSPTAVRAKSVEIAVKMVLNLPLQTFEAVDVLRNPRASSLEKMRAIEKKFLGSFISLVRSVVEGDHLRELHYRDLSPEEQAQLKIPIYEMDGEDVKIVGYGPFDLNECLTSIAEYERAIPKLNITEAVIEMGGVTKILGISKAAFNLLTLRTVVRIAHSPHVLRGQQDVNDRDELIEESSESEEESIEELCDLRRWNFIPIELEEDPVLKQFTCAITQRPIRHIVADPTTGNRTYYEKTAIEAWLRTCQNSPKSPMTKKILFKSQLVHCPLLQAKIDQRLDLYSQKLQAEIKRIYEEPINQIEIDDAIAAVVQPI